MSKKLTNTDAAPALVAKIQRRAALKPVRAKDRSTVLKLVEPPTRGSVTPGMVESTLKAGKATLLHRHNKSEEVCYIISGNGRVTLGDDWHQVRAGDTIQIPPGTVHKVEATGSFPLKMLVSSFPACSDDDIEVLEVPSKADEPKTQTILRKLDEISAMTETKPSAKKIPKVPKLAFTTGPELKALRTKLRLNQSEFWRRIQVTQSGGSRYESGRNVPKPVALLLNLAYGTEKQAMAVMEYLRTTTE